MLESKLAPFLVAESPLSKQLYPTFRFTISPLSKFQKGQLVKQKNYKIGSYGEETQNLNLLFYNGRLFLEQKIMVVLDQEVSSKEMLLFQANGFGISPTNNIQYGLQSLEANIGMSKTVGTLCTFGKPPTGVLGKEFHKQHLSSILSLNILQATGMQSDFGLMDGPLLNP